MIVRQHHARPLLFFHPTLASLDPFRSFLKALPTDERALVRHITLFDGLTDVFIKELLSFPALESVETLTSVPARIPASVRHLTISCRSQFPWDSPPDTLSSLRRSDMSSLTSLTLKGMTFVSDCLGSRSLMGLSNLRQLRLLVDGAPYSSRIERGLISTLEVIGEQLHVLEVVATVQSGWDAFNLSPEILRLVPNVRSLAFPNGNAFLLSHSSTFPQLRQLKKIYFGSPGNALWSEEDVWRVRWMNEVERIVHGLLVLYDSSSIVVADPSTTPSPSGRPLLAQLKLFDFTFALPSPPRATQRRVVHSTVKLPALRSVGFWGLDFQGHPAAKGARKGEKKTSPVGLLDEVVRQVREYGLEIVDRYGRTADGGRIG